MCSTHLLKHRAQDFLQGAAVDQPLTPNPMASVLGLPVSLISKPNKQMLPFPKLWLRFIGKNAISAGLLQSFVSNLSKGGIHEKDCAD